MAWQHVNAVRELGFNHARPSGYWLVLYVLASYADQHTDVCFPSIETIAKGARMTSKQARRHVQQLKLDNLIEAIRNERGGKPGTTTHYRINVAHRTPARGGPTTPIIHHAPSHTAVKTAPADGSLKNNETIYKEDEMMQQGVPPPPDIRSWILKEIAKPRIKNRTNGA